MTDESSTDDRGDKHARRLAAHLAGRAPDGEAARELLRLTDEQDRKTRDEQPSAEHEPLTEDD